MTRSESQLPYKGPHDHALTEYCTAACRKHPDYEPKPPEPCTCCDNPNRSGAHNVGCPRFGTGLRDDNTIDPSFTEPKLPTYTDCGGLPEQCGGTCDGCLERRDIERRGLEPELQENPCCRGESKACSVNGPCPQWRDKTENLAPELPTHCVHGTYLAHDECLGNGEGCAESDTHTRSKGNTPILEPLVCICRDPDPKPPCPATEHDYDPIPHSRTDDDSDLDELLESWVAWKRTQLECDCNDK